MSNIEWLSAKCKDWRGGWDSVCHAKTFELYSVGNGQLLKVYKHGSNMTRFIFWKDDWGK